MIARDLEPPQPNRVWPGHTALQIYLYLNPAGEAFPPLGPAAADGTDPCSRGLSLQGAGDVAADGLYEVRNLPPGRYRACFGGRLRLYKDNILVNADVDGINFNLP